MKKFLMLAVLLVGTCIEGTAQIITPTSKFILNVDYARFKNNDSTGYVELYYLFYPGLVSVARTDDGSFNGKIFLRIVGKHTGTGAVYVNEMRSLPVSVSDTTQLSSSNTVVSLAGYVLPFGVYEFSVTASDSIDDAREDSLSFTVTISPLPAETSVSDLELCSRIQQSTAPGSFVKNTLEVVPNATLMFGVSNHPVVFHYVELYNMKGDQPYMIKTSVLDASGLEIRSSSRQRSFTVPNAVDVGTMNVTSLPSGRYIYQLSVMEDTVRSVARARKVFFAYNPHIKQTTVSGATLKASELAGLSFDELGAEFDAATYLASSDDNDAFDKLTTAEARRQFMGQFWSEVERGKGGREPMRRLDYMSRVKTSIEKFRIHGRPGWKTDRGRVFLVYGEPDEIERIASDEESKPHEIWYYYRLDNGVHFVFIDRTGFGDYVLVHSTKRGELQDDTWSRLLR